MLLDLARGLWGRRTDLAVVVTATAGLWLFWSEYSNVAALSWWYDRLQRDPGVESLPPPDYDMTTLPWKAASPRVLDLQPDRLRLVTGLEPFAYQVFATVKTNGASSAGIQFEAEIESGGATIGLLQSGKWIIVSSSQRPGVFAGADLARLGYSRSITVMIANNNTAGETHLILQSLRLYLRR